MKTNGFCFLGRANRITQRAIEAFPESVTIYSMWKGYLDKSHPAFDEYKSAFAELAAAIGSKIEFLHTSGHATAEDIAKVCHITGAKTVIPIHGENPEAFKNLNIDNEIKILQDGEDYLI